MSDTRQTPAETPAAAPGGDIFSDPVFLRNLKIAVVVMALILILGFVAIIARIIYLSSRAPAQPARPAMADAPAMSEQRATNGPAAGLVAKGRLDLPQDAAVRALSLSGNRLAVQYDAPAGPGIAILDLESGRTLSRIEIGAEGPR
jgi:hypothetical protein